MDEEAKKAAEATEADNDADVVDMEGVTSTTAIETLPRPEFLDYVYTAVEDVLADLIEDPANSELYAKVEEANQGIEAKNKHDGGSISKDLQTKALVDVTAISELFIKHKAANEKLGQGPQDGVPKAELNSIATEFASLVKEHGYPERWEILLPLTDSSAHDAHGTSAKPAGQAGYTLRGEPILGCRKFMGGYRYYVEIMVNQKKPVLSGP